MEVYCVGQDELDFTEDDRYEWVVYEYTEDWYEGYGEAVALRKDGLLCIFNLGHCSCYGPLDEWPNPGEVQTVQDYIRPIESAIDERSNPIVEKIRELVQSPA